MRRRTWVLALTLSLCAPARALAQPVGVHAEADDLFRKGREAQERGECKVALELFHKSQDLEPGRGKLLNIAICEEKIGLLATAMQHFQELVPQLAGDPRLSLVNEHIAGLGPRVPHLKIELAASVPSGTTVTCDAAPLAPAALGSEMPVDPGAHVIIVSAPGRPARRYDVTVEEGKRTDITVEPGVAVQQKESSPPPPPVKPAAHGRFFIEAEVAAGLAPSFDGDIAASCSSSCSSEVGVGFLGLGHVGYRFSSGFMLGINGGFLLVSQKTSNRKAAIQAVGLSMPDDGAAVDRLTLSGGLLGAWAGLRINPKLPVTLRVGGGALIGSLKDHRTGIFHTVDRPQHPTTPYSLDEPGANEVRPASSIYIAPEARLGLPLGEHFEVSAGLGAFVLIPLSQPKWVPEEQLVSAGSDGQGSFPAETLTGKAIVILSPGLSARYEF